MTREHFMQFVNTEGHPKGCWIWTGGIGNGGYGLCQVGDKKVLAHRHSYFLEHGNQPEHNVLHECDNPACVNPAHLKDGTQSQNMLDAADRGRIATGTRHHSHKLTEAQVLEIVNTCGPDDATEFAKRFGVHRNSIVDILNGKTWRHIRREQDLELWLSRRATEPRQRVSKSIQSFAKMTV